jgi:hypothetical protein
MPGSFLDFFRNWYNNGIYAPPPICMKSKTLRRYWSDNECCGCPCSCVKVGRWGLSSWGERHRSHIMFAAFWSSFLTMVLLSIPFASLSTTGSTIRDTNWASFTIKTDSGSASVSSIAHYDFYLGLRQAAVSCSGSNCAYHEETYSLSSGQCSFDFCQQCASAAEGTETGAFLGFITMIVQLSGDLTRSTRSADMNCQKFMGILTAVIGFCSTLSSLSSFTDACYNNIPDSHAGASIHPLLGPSFWCTLVSALLKLVELVAHAVVPAPPAGEGYDPDRDAEGVGVGNGSGGGGLGDKLLSSAENGSSGDGGSGGWGDRESEVDSPVRPSTSNHNEL